MIRFTTNYNKLKYEGVKLTINNKEQVVTIMDNPKMENPMKLTP